MRIIGACVGLVWAVVLAILLCVLCVCLLPVGLLGFLWQCVLIAWALGIDGAVTLGKRVLTTHR